MKNFPLTMIFLLFFNVCAFSQLKSKYQSGFEKGFVEGYCYNKNKYNCYTPITPFILSPKLNESRENYTEGYNRGFQYGLDLSRSNEALSISDVILNEKIASFNKYVPQNPIEEMRIVGIIRQKKFDARIEWLQQKIYQLTDLYETLFNEENFSQGFQTYSHKNKLRDVIVDYFDKIKLYDFGDDYVFQNVQSNLKNIESYYFEYYNSIVTQIKQNTEIEETRASDTINSNRNIQKTNFSGFLESNYGLHSCLINEYVLIENKYIQKGTKDGEINLQSNYIIFSTKEFESGREFLSETIDNDAKELIYKTEFGNVVIDFDFKKIIFYNLDNKNYYVYIVKSKL